MKRVAYRLSGGVRYGLAARSISGSGQVLVFDAVLPMTMAVSCYAISEVLPASFPPEYDATTGLLERGGDDYDRFADSEFRQALKVSSEIGYKEVKPGKLFSIFTEEGSCYYVVMSVGDGKAVLGWRGFEGRRAYPPYGFDTKKVRIEDVASFVKSSDRLSSWISHQRLLDGSYLRSLAPGSLVQYDEGDGRFVWFEVTADAQYRYASLYGDWSGVDCSRLESLIASGAVTRWLWRDRIVECEDYKPRSQVVESKNPPSLTGDQ
jgi:hypothetical protein